MSAPETKSMQFFLTTARLLIGGILLYLGVEYTREPNALVQAVPYVENTLYESESVPLLNMSGADFVNDVYKPYAPLLFVVLGAALLIVPAGTFVFLLRLTLGIWFIYAGTMKIFDPGKFADNIEQYKIIGDCAGCFLPAALLNPTALILPWLEVLAGVALILLPFMRHAATFLILCMLLLFIAAQSWALVKGYDIECGCTSSGKKVGWMNVFINSSWVWACLVIIAWTNFRRKNPHVEGAGNHSS